MGFYNIRLHIPKETGNWKIRTPKAYRKRNSVEKPKKVVLKMVEVPSGPTAGDLSCDGHNYLNPKENFPTVTLEHAVKEGSGIYSGGL